MEQEVQDQLSGSINPEAVLGLIGGRAKRNSQKKAAKIVKNSVPASKRQTKITKEQGFRNYLQYTDPLLLNNNEVDKSDIAASLANILNVFTPKKMETKEIQEVKKFVSTQTPVNPDDIASEVSLKVQKDEAAAKIQDVYKDYKANKETKNKAATKIQSIVKGHSLRKNELPKIKEADKKEKAAKKIVEWVENKRIGKEAKLMYDLYQYVPDRYTHTLEGDDRGVPLPVNMSEKKMNTKATKLAATYKAHLARKDTKPFIEIQAARMKKYAQKKNLKIDKDTKIKSFVRRNDNGKFDERAFGNNGYNTSLTDYTGSANIIDVNNETYYGEWVRIDLKENVILKKYKISPQNERLTRGPGSFRIYGSTDNITHHFIDERTNQIYTTGQSLTFSIPNNQEQYRYYTIIVNKLSLPSPFGSVAISEWELYGANLSVRTLEYNWDIPEITLNQSGKISMEAKTYNTFTQATIPTTTRIKNIGSTKYNYNSKKDGVVIDLSNWDYSKKKKTICPPIPLAPQTINKISLSIKPENGDDGIDVDSDFVAVLKITEDDVPETRWGSTNAVNVRQMPIPTYN